MICLATRDPPVVSIRSPRHSTDHGPVGAAHADRGGCRCCGQIVPPGNGGPSRVPVPTLRVLTPLVRGRTTQNKAVKSAVEDGLPSCCLPCEKTPVCTLQEQAREKGPRLRVQPRHHRAGSVYGATTMCSGSTRQHLNIGIHPGSQLPPSSTSTPRPTRGVPEDVPGIDTDGLLAR